MAASLVAHTGPRASLLVVKVGKVVSAARIAGATGLSIPRGSQGTLRISILSGLRSCRFAGTSVRGTARGTCTVRALYLPKKGRTVSRTVTVKVVT